MTFGCDTGIVSHQLCRVLRDDPSKSDMHNRQGLTPRMLWNALSDWRMWPLYILGLVHMSELITPITYWKKPHPTPSTRGPAPDVSYTIAS